MKIKNMPSATRGKAHGAWRFAHSTNRIIRFAPCALRFAHNPPQKLFISTSVISVSSVAKKIYVNLWQN